MEGSGIHRLIDVIRISSPLNSFLFGGLVNPQFHKTPKRRQGQRQRTVSGLPPTPRSRPRNPTAPDNPPSPGARVNVAVRVRPLSEHESKTSSIIRVVGHNCLVFEVKAEAEPFYSQGQRACGGPRQAKPNIYV
ncbi:hypothetical protein MRX96_015802 [Rhipicephalus microplus]